MYPPGQGLFPEAFCPFLADFSIPNQGGKCNGGMAWKVINISMIVKVASIQTYILKWSPGNFNVDNANRMSKSLLNNQLD